MSTNYNYHYEIQEELDTNSSILKSPELYNYDAREIYAAAMNLAAKPLSNGEESPFSSQSPNSTHARLFEVISYLQSLIGYEINLIPDNVWIQLLRLRGVEPKTTRYPILEMEFARYQRDIDNQRDLLIPVGTKVYSKKYPNRYVITTSELLISGNKLSGKVSARFNSKGETPDIIKDEYTINRSIANLNYVTNTGVILQQGFSGEDISSLVKRVRDQENRRERIVTQRDLALFASENGADKSLILSNVFVDKFGEIHPNSITTLFVYSKDNQESIIPRLKFNLEKEALIGYRIIPKFALIVPLTGELSVQMASGSKQLDTFDTVAEIISNSVNPPYGEWGNLKFKQFLISKLESDPRINKVIIEELKISNLEDQSINNQEKTNLNNHKLYSHQEFDTIKVMSWYLFQIQNDIKIKPI